MAEEESLFSLEVVVESLENVIVPCQTPAIAFRLLDFPTLVIRKQDKSSKEIHDDSNFDTNEVNNGHTIQAGKSCLFKMNKNALFSQLESTPLYLMLVDVSGSIKAKLLASTTLPLTACFEKVLENIEANGLDMPAVHGNRGLFELYNLMGTPVARVKLSYRIFSLGGTINGHVNIAQPVAKPSYSTPSCIIGREDQIMVNGLKSKRESLKRGERIVENESGDLAQVLNIERQSELFDVETQTERFNKIEKQHTPESECKDNERKEKIGRQRNINVTRPPPLYYNSESIPTIRRPVTVSTQIKYSGSSNTRSDNVTSDTDMLSNVNPGTQSTANKCYHTVSVQTSEQSKPEIESDSLPHNKESKVVDLPLIDALLKELSMAKQNILDQAHTSSVKQPCALNKDPQKPSCVKTQKVIFSQPHNPAVTQKSQNVKSLPSKLKVNTKPWKANQKGNLIQRKPIKFKKSTLKIHTTKTQKLREALNKKQQNEIGLASHAMELQEDISKSESSKQNTTRVVVHGRRPGRPRETNEFACQVGHDAFKSSKNGETHFKEMGVQVASSMADSQDVHVSVQHSDLVQFNKEDLPLSAGHTPRNMSPCDTTKRHSLEDNNFAQLSSINSNVLNVRLPEHHAEVEEPFPAASNSDWFSHSRKPTTTLPVVSKPTLSKHSPVPPARRNSRYTKDEGVMESKEAHLSDSGGSMRERSVLAKSIDVSMSSSVEMITKNSRYTKSDTATESKESSDGASKRDKDPVSKSMEIPSSNSSGVEQISKNSRYTKEKSADESKLTQFSNNGSLLKEEYFARKSNIDTTLSNSSSIEQVSKNSRYTKDEASVIKSEEVQDSATDSITEGMNLVAKSVDITFSNSNLEEHAEYSDKFDSFESEHTTENESK